jgi:flagellar motor switch protein FliM
MAGVLDQNEVDALLAAVEGGEIDASSDFTQSALAFGADAASIYDFKRPERVSKEQQRSLENLHEVFARNLSATWGAYLRQVVEVQLASVEQLTYSEFIMSLANPTCFNILHADPMEGEIILELNHSLVFPIIDKLLGGGIGLTTPPDRQLTEIEERIIKRIIDLSLDDLKIVWERIYDVNFMLHETESNPQLRQIVSPNEVVVLLSFEVIIGEATGMMNLCIPYLVIEPIMDLFATQNLYLTHRKESTDRQKDSIIDSLTGAQLEFVCNISESSMKVKDFLKLKVGDIVQSTKPFDEPLVVTINGKPKFKTKPVIYRHNKAFQIVDEADVHTRI